jgi:hypothetical protein
MSTVTGAGVVFTFQFLLCPLLLVQVLSFLSSSSYVTVTCAGNAIPFQFLLCPLLLVQVLPFLSSSSYVHCYWCRCCHSFLVPPVSTVTGEGVAIPSQFLLCPLLLVQVLSFLSSSSYVTVTCAGTAIPFQFLLCPLLLIHWYSGNPPFKVILSPLSYITCAEYMISLLRIQRIEFHFFLHFQLGFCSLSQSCQVLVRFPSQFGKTLGTCGKKFGHFAAFFLQVFSPGKKKFLHQFYKKCSFVL